MQKTLKTVITVLVIVLVVVFALFSMTGLYMMPPKDLPPDGATFWYLRRGTGLPFLASPDSQKSESQASTDSRFVAIAPKTGSIIAKLAFSRSLYLRTTGGIDYLK